MRGGGLYRGGTAGLGGLVRLFPLQETSLRGWLAGGGAPLHRPSCQISHCGQPRPSRVDSSQQGPAPVQSSGTIVGYYRPQVKRRVVGALENISRGAGTITDGRGFIFIFIHQSLTVSWPRSPANPPFLFFSADDQCLPHNPPPMCTCMCRPLYGDTCLIRTTTGRIISPCTQHSQTWLVLSGCLGTVCLLALPRPSACSRPATRTVSPPPNKVRPGAHIVPVLALSPNPNLCGRVNIHRRVQDAVYHSTGTWFILVISPNIATPKC